MNYLSELALATSDLQKAYGGINRYGTDATPKDRWGRKRMKPQSIDQIPFYRTSMLVHDKEGRLKRSRQKLATDAFHNGDVWDDFEFRPLHPSPTSSAKALSKYLTSQGHPVDYKAVMQAVKGEVPHRTWEEPNANPLKGHFGGNWDSRDGLKHLTNVATHMATGGTHVPGTNYHYTDVREEE